MIMVHNQSAPSLYNNLAFTSRKINKTIEGLHYGMYINRSILDSLDSSDFTNGRLRGPHHFTINGTKIAVRDQSTITDIVNSINKERAIIDVFAEDSGGKLQLIGVDNFSPITVMHRKAAVYEIHGNIHMCHQNYGVFYPLLQKSC